MLTIGVVGGGAWGTALAQVFSKGGRDVLLWAREPEVAQAINTHHENSVFLRGVPLDPALKATNDLAEVARRDIILLVAPTQHIRATLTAMKQDLKAETILVICAKGVELQTGKLLSEVCQDVVPQNDVAIMTGPTFAYEVASGLPVAVTIAAKNKDTALLLQKNLGLKNFRPYVTEDMIGAQLGGAVKNVIAIACGVVYGRQLGESACAGLLTRGLAEIARLAVAMGAKRQTLMGMCGIGDLMLTATSMQSRNFSFGAALGEGKTMEEILRQRNAVTEGIYTAESTLALARKYGVDMPITEAVYKCLHEKLPVEGVIEEMLGRPFRADSGEREE